MGEVGDVGMSGDVGVRGNEGRNVGWEGGLEGVYNFFCKFCIFFLTIIIVGVRL